MSDMNIQTIDPNALVDMFPEMGAGAKLSANFSAASGTQNTDILSTPPKADTPTPPATPPPKTDKETDTDIKDIDKDVDILGDGVPAGTPQTATTIADLSSYYQDRIKNGKFVQINVEDDKGNLVPFIPKTAEDYDEVLEMQVDYKLNNLRKEVEEKWFETKSPAWRAISQYAELVDDPTELIPFLQGVRTMQSVANLDENQPDGAEQIVRTRLSQRGDPEKVINQQIEALKTTDTLVATAKEYKPLILEQERQELARITRTEQEEKRKYLELIEDIRKNAVSAIEQPLFGKIKPKQEEKAVIYDLIGYPQEETGGYGIYTAIDNLFDKKDFETLKLVALLIGKKDAFFNYLGTNIANQTHASLERKLRVAAESHSSSSNGMNADPDRPAVTKTNYGTRKPNFGR